MREQHAGNRRTVSEFREALGLSLDALCRNPLRSFLTVLGIVIGVSTVIAIAAVVNGLNSSVVSQIQALGSNVIICYRFSFVTLGRRPVEELQRKELKAEWANGVALLPHVVAATPSARIQNMDFGAGTSYVRRGDIRVKNVILQGNAPEVAQINNMTLERGRFFNDTDQLHHSPVVVLGSDTADALFANHEDAIGKEVLIEGHAYTVVGVLVHQGQAFGNGKNPEDNIAIFPLSTLLQLHPEYKDFAILVKADEAQNVPEVVDEVRDYLRRMRRLTSGKPDDFAVFTTDSFIDLWKQISEGIFALMFAVGSVALLVGGIGVMNIMLVSVTERTREIGVRKAVGASRHDILIQFLIESITIALIGGLLGEILGVALSFAVRVLFPALPASVSSFWVVLGFSVSALIGVFFGVYPAWKAANLNPVEALRYE